MEKIREQNVVELDIDEQGYLFESEGWTPDIAIQLAQDQGLASLTDDQWKVILYIRQYYLEFGMVPPVRKLSRETGFTLRQMKKMFPAGLADSACKIAGIPRTGIKPSFLYP